MTSDVDTLLSLLATSDSSFTVPFTLHPLIIAFKNTIATLTDKVEKSRYLSACQPAPRAPQLQLLEEWCINDDLPKFRHKLCVNPDVFACIIQRIKGHPVFSNNSNNPQLGVPIQFAIFLNGVGHYGNGATTEDLAEWVGVSTGTIYNCFRHVMITLLHFHDDVIHFDPMELEDQEERERAKEWVESHSCMGWRKGFLCVDGSPFNLFQKPGWHGEGFFDCKSRYSLSSQVIILPHNLRIVDYVIGVPGSLHNSNTFSCTHIYCHLETFLGVDEWIWANSAYPSLPWCVVPFKRPTTGSMPAMQKIFNQHLSRVNQLFFSVPSMINCSTDSCLL
ncbi:hypothetical protein SCLCIDRAFT_135412 [Scleroderma citrinum Foug A]|uniref:DDE Tnp4 domain-containing protein n=1 Tax=Scleroderma citrinum Foug A TaxID=1036808 RepID=A0A0C2ZR52_9AGAM|nr:hypothetical protein SCLCIDRAFT_135412 [Scleroderma citrinum Foug A]